MTFRKIPEIETDRLILRGPNSGDVNAVATCIYADADVMQYLPKRNLAPRDRAERKLHAYEQLWKEQPIGGFVVISKASTEFVGLCEVKISTETHEWEVGYFLAKAYWGKGLATEAVRAMIRLAFDRIDAPQLLAAVVRENTASRCVLERLGFVHERDLNYYELTGDNTIQLESPIVPCYVLHRNAFDSGDGFYQVTGSDHT